MRLAIVHHHLNRGGVTQVIANHLGSLATLPAGERPERAVVFFDGQRDGWPDDLPDHESVVVPELAYDAPGDAADPAGLAETLQAALSEQGLAADDTLLHVHNHALGKKAGLPGALKRLAEDGWRLLLQVHDFAEDNRPQNYQHLQEAIGEADPTFLGALLYPQGDGIHYATLTERDAEVFRNAGVAPTRLHTLPNPVAEFGEMPSQQAARKQVFAQLNLPAEARLIVYPVRGIRRKNLGEMLLLSALAPEGTFFAVTLRPKNPVEAASFDRWRRLADRLGLPCRFDTGGSKQEGGYGCEFKETLAAADAILTTSVAEGFGMVFLEAWLAGKPLIGRDLPEITREFVAAGMSFDGMWSELRSPLELDADFGSLTPAEQAVLIHETRRPSTPLDLGLDGASEQIVHNTEVVRSHYSGEAIGRRLAEVYADAMSRVDAPRPEADFGRIAMHFAQPERQHPVRFDAGLGPTESLIASLSQTLEPKPTGERPSAPRLEGVRAVVFDVYGTLLVSGSGDISLASEGSRGDAALAALRAAGIDPGEADGDRVVERLHQAIHTFHGASPSEHPEVEIREMWSETLQGLGLRAEPGAVERLSVEYECRVNPIWRMPGLKETLLGITGAGLSLGIVSNAQFFTPLAFEPLTGRSLRGWGFDPDLCVWSYEHREAKPGTFLYERCAEALRRQGVEPREALFVGNDLRNDVWPAQRVGFRTALFAGDARSLRWRRDDTRLEAIRPDAVVTELSQLLEVVL